MKATTEALTGKQKLFADLYVGECSLNATRAAQRAGYAGDDNALAAAGSRLLRNVKVRAYIDEQLSDLYLSKNEVLAILSRQAKASLADVLTEEGEFDLSDAKKRGVDGLIKKLKVRRTYSPKTEESETTYEYEMYDSQAAAVQLGKVHRLFVDRLEQSGETKVTVVFKKANGGDGDSGNTDNG